MDTKKASKLLFWAALLALLAFGLRQSFKLLAGRQSGSSASPIITEFMAANGTGLVDEDGSYSDWIELYNPGNTPINLAGWALTDDPDQPEKWTFPDITLGSQAYLLIFASGKDHKSTEPGAMLHTNFRLHRAGEFLGLYNILQGTFADSLSPQFSPQFRDIAYGRYGSQSAYGYLANPTPGEPNDETLVWKELIPAVSFSVERGFYETPFTLTLATEDPDAVIRYTTDGTEPAEDSGVIYSRPIPIDKTTTVRAAAFKPGHLPAYLETHTYIFLDEVLTTPPNPAGWPATWGIHPEDFKDYKQGTPVIADYEMDPEVVNDPRYRDTIKEDLKSIPSLSLVMDMQDFTDIYSHPRDRGVAWERPVSVELIEPDRSGQGFQINAGIRMHGGVGRREFIPKHSFRLLFKGQYGPTKLRYPLFPDSSVEAFDTLVLRAGADRSFAGTGPVRELTTYTRDEWLRSSQIAMSGIGSHGIFVHLYINGLYWGLYNVVERPDASFLSSYLGGTKEDWFVANQDGPLDRNLDHRSEALSELFITLGFAGRANDDLTDIGDDVVEKYAAVKAHIDYTQFSDYIILNWYAGTEDWPQNNWYAGIRNPDGQFKLIVWDGQETFDGDGAQITLGETGKSRLNIVKPLFELLIQDPQFRLEFADRMYKHLFNDGALTDARARERWLQINQVIERAIVGESARWGDVREEPPITQDDWFKARDDVLAQLEGNAARLVALAREAGFYPDIDPPRFNQQGGLIEPGFKLAMNVPADYPDQTVYYTTDGTDPALAETGEIAPGAIKYRSPVVLTTTTLVKARALAGPVSGSEVTTSNSAPIWSALNEATFTVAGRENRLAITEIMYNPPGGSDYEFIELQNVGETELSLAGLEFDEGISFTFPPGAAPLPPGEFVVLVRNPAAVAERYPGLNTGGVYRGKLSNEGEKLSIRDSAGSRLILIEYDDENGWPLSPDGRGDSLILIDPDGDPASPKSWRASPTPNGSPGRNERL